MSAGGFLLEALLAVLILSVGLVGLIRGLLSSLNAAKETEAYARAIFYADNALLEVIRLNGVQVNFPVQTDALFSGIQTRIDIASSNQGHWPKALRQAEVQVTWPGPLKEKGVSATTLVFGPFDENP